MTRALVRGLVFAVVLTLFLFGLGYFPVAVAILLWIVLALVVARRPQPPRQVTVPPSR